MSALEFLGIDRASLPRTLAIPAAVKVTGIPRSTIRDLVSRGEVAGIRTGRKVRVVTASLLAFIEGSMDLDLVRARRNYVRGGGR